MLRSLKSLEHHVVRAGGPHKGSQLIERLFVIADVCVLIADVAIACLARPRARVAIAPQAPSLAALAANAMRPMRQLRRSPPPLPPAERTMFETFANAARAHGYGSPMAFRESGHTGAHRVGSVTHAANSDQASASSTR